MADVFISYSFLDKETCIRLVRELGTRSIASVFAAGDPDRGLEVGMLWEKELYGRLRSCRIVIAIDSPASRRSRWCFAEIALAKALGKPILPITTGRTRGHHPLLAGVQSAVLSPADFDAIARRIRDTYTRHGIVWDSARPPYPGLAPFDTADAPVFYGRDDDIRAVVDRLRARMRPGRARTLAVLGASGCGKTSFVNAGVIPAALAMDWRVVPPFTPTSYSTPLRSLIKSIKIGSARPGGNGRVPKPIRLRDTYWKHLPASQRILIVLDQAEELLTRYTAADHHEFASYMDELLAIDDRVTVMTVARIDLLARDDRRQEWGSLLEDAWIMHPLDASSLTSIVTAPAGMSSIQVDANVVSDLVRDTGNGDALPLLAYTLRALYDEMGSDRRITVDMYRQSGGVDGSIERYGNWAVAPVLQSAPDVVRKCLSRLVDIAPGTAVRRMAPLSEFQPREVALVQRLVDARILRQDVDSDGLPQVAVTHEAVLRVWSPFVNVISALEHVLRLRAEFEASARAWREADYDPGYLLAAARSADAAEVIDRLEPAEGSLLRTWLAESVSHQERAQSQRSTTLARRIAQNISPTIDWELPLLLSIHGIERYGPLLELVDAAAGASVAAPTTVVADTDQALVHTLAVSSDGSIVVGRSGATPYLLRRPLTGGKTRIAFGLGDSIDGYAEDIAVAWSRTNRWVAIAWDVQVVVFEAVDVTRPIGSWLMDGVRAVAFDGMDRLWIGSRKGHLWHTRIAGQPQHVRVFTSGVTSISIGTRTVAVGFFDGYVRTFDLTGSEIRAGNRFMSGSVTVVGVLSAEPKVLVSLSDGSAVLWRPINAQTSPLLVPSQTRTAAMAVDARGRAIVVRTDGQVLRGDPKTGNALLPLLRIRPTETVALDASASYMASSIDGRTVTIADIASYIERTERRDEEADVASGVEVGVHIYSVQFRPDGPLVIGTDRLIPTGVAERYSRATGVALVAGGRVNEHQVWHRRGSRSVAKRFLEGSEGWVDTPLRDPRLSMLGHYVMALSAETSIWESDEGWLVVTVRPPKAVHQYDLRAFGAGDWTHIRTSESGATVVVRDKLILFLRDGAVSQHVTTADVSTIAISHDGTSASAGLKTGQVLLWRHGVRPALFDGHVEKVWSTMFTGGALVAATVGRDGSEIFWDVENSHLISSARLRGHIRAFSPSQRIPRVLTSTSYGVFAWRLNAPVEQLSGERSVSAINDDCECSSISSDPDYVAICSDDRITVTIAHGTDKRTMAVALPSLRRVALVAFACDTHDLLAVCYTPLRKRDLVKFWARSWHPEPPELIVYDATTGALAGRMSLPTGSASIESASKFGRSGLALLSTSGQISMIADGRREIVLSANISDMANGSMPWVGGPLAVASRAGQVAVVELPTIEVVPIEGLPDLPYVAWIDARARFMVLGYTHGTVELRALPDARVVRTVVLKGEPSAVLLSEAAVLCIGADDGSIVYLRIADDETGTAAHSRELRFRGASSPVTALSVREAFLVAGHLDGSVEVWHIENGLLANYPTVLRGPVESVDISVKSCRVAAATFKGRLWSTAVSGADATADVRLARIPSDDGAIASTIVASALEALDRTSRGLTRGLTEMELREFGLAQ